MILLLLFQSAYWLCALSGGDILIADEIMNAKREENDGTLSKLNEKICSIQIKEVEKKRIAKFLLGPFFWNSVAFSKATAKKTDEKWSFVLYMRVDVRALSH